MRVKKIIENGNLADGGGEEKVWAKKVLGERGGGYAGSESRFEK